jgi:hypothetical protein
MVNLAVYPETYGQFTSGDLISVPTNENTIAELYSLIRSLEMFPLRVSPVSGFCNTAVEWRLHRRSRELFPTGKERKHT